MGRPGLPSHQTLPRECCREGHTGSATVILSGRGASAPPRRLQSLSTPPSCEAGDGGFPYACGGILKWMTSVPRFGLRRGICGGGTGGSKARRASCSVPASQAGMSFKEGTWLVSLPNCQSFVFMI